jgi:TRAP-type C4-dicarboxylate transport system permease small subunit
MNLGITALVVVMVLAAAATGFLRRKHVSIEIETGEILRPPLRPASKLGILFLILWVLTLYYGYRQFGYVAWNGTGTLTNLGLAEIALRAGVFFAYLAGIFFAVTTVQNVIDLGRRGVR